MRSEQLLPSNVELIPAAREQEQVLANLLEFYVYDFSEFIDVVVEADGRFHYPSLSAYWGHENRFPFLVKVDGELAGLMLIARGSLINGDPEIWDMAEFFIMRRYRRRGIGAALAHEVWRRFAGAWEGARDREQYTCARILESGCQWVHRLHRRGFLHRAGRQTAAGVLV